MLLQVNIINHIVNFWIVLALIIVLISFSTSTLITYEKYKHKLALILSFHYMAYIIGMVFYLIAHFIVIQDAEKSALYLQLTTIPNIFTMTGMILNLYFYEQFARINIVWRYLYVVSGVLVILWIMNPINFNPADPNYSSIKAMTYILMALYGYIAYGALTSLFFKGYKKDKQNQLLAMAFGSLMFLVYFIIITLYGVLIIEALSILSQLILLSAFVFYFIGIYLPKIKS